MANDQLRRLQEENHNLRAKLEAQMFLVNNLQEDKTALMQRLENQERESQVRGKQILEVSF